MLTIYNHKDTKEYLTIKELESEVIAIEVNNLIGSPQNWVQGYMYKIKDIYKQTVSDYNESLHKEIFGQYDKATAERLYRQKKFDFSDNSIQVFVFKHLIENYIDETPEEFFSSVSAVKLHELNLTALYDSIYLNAPEEIQERECFIKRSVVISVTYPELHDLLIKPITDESIFNCTGELKRAFSRVSSMKENKLLAILGANDKAAKNESKDERPRGGYVDKLIYNAINNIMEQAGIIAFEDKLDYIARIRHTYQRILKLKLPGCLSVIESRGVYNSYLDFFYFNSNKQDALRHWNDFVEIREKCENAPQQTRSAAAMKCPYKYIAKDPMIEKLKNVMPELINRELNN